MKERVIEKAVCEFAKKRGWLVRKFTSPGSAGAPDRIFLKDGHCLFVEFKSPDGKLTPLQVLQHKHFAAAGFPVYVCNNVEDGKRIVLRNEL